MRPIFVLVADDDPPANELLRAYIEAEGWQPYTVVNGDEAIKFVHENNPDLVIVNVDLPGSSGTDVCRHVTATSKIPVVMLSNRRDRKERTQCFDLGAADYVTKPFGPQDLMDRIRELLLRNRVNDIGSRHPAACRREIKLYTKRVVCQGYKIPAVPKEYKLPKEFASGADNDLTSRKILQECIDSLRAKIEPDPENPIYIVSVPGVGYRFEPGGTGGIKAKS